jgi:hypothetical protein
MYLSAASRTTHASDTLLTAAIRSSSWYVGVGKLIEARVVPDDDSEGLIIFRAGIRTSQLCTILHHNGACGEDRPQAGDALNGEKHAGEGKNYFANVRCFISTSSVGLRASLDSIRAM